MGRTASTTRHVVAKLGELLIEVSGHDALAHADAALIGLGEPQQATQERCLAAPIGPQQRPTLAADDVEIQIAEQRAVVTLGHTFGPHDDVAAALGRRETHRGRGDLPRRRHKRHPLELLAAIFGLRVLLPIVVAANEVLRLIDLDLLLFVGPPFDQQPLGLLPPVGREVPGVAIDGAGEEFERAVGHAVEEIAVVAHDDHGGRALDQEILEPFGGIDVEMVAGLVEEHHVGLGQQELGEHKAILLAAAERRDRLAERPAPEPQPVEHLLDAMVEVVGVLAVQFVLEMIVAAGQPLLFGRIGGLGDQPGRFLRLPLQGEQVGQSALGFVVQGAAGIEIRLLLEVAQASGRMELGANRRRRRPCRPGFSAASSFRCRWALPIRSGRPGAART